MTRIGTLLARVAPTNATVLITGESGSGKEVVARAIHRMSRVWNAAFVAVNCAAIPESLLEAQLFGHVKGAFTGADGTQPGWFQRADGGTILLDEIGELPMHLQAKVLRVIEEKEVVPVGTTTPLRVHVRIVASTNRDLRRAVSEGRFREDLYYRLNVVGIHVPPLRERREDIPLLIDHVIAQQNEELGRRCRGVTNAALQVLMALPWPGNVRELRHAIEYAMIVGDGEWIRPEHLPPELLPEPPATHARDDSLSEALRSFEKAYLENLLRHDAANRKDLAVRLGIDPSTLYRKLQNLGIKTTR